MNWRVQFPSGEASSVQLRQDVGSNAAGLSEISQFLKDGEEFKDEKTLDKEKETCPQANLIDLDYSKKTQCPKVREGLQCL